VDIESNQSTPEFDEFVAGGEVEVGKTDGEEGAEEKEKPAAKRGPPKPAAPAAKETGRLTMATMTTPGKATMTTPGKTMTQKPAKKSAKDHQIERLKREKAALMRGKFARAEARI
jgi:hypothetical protein